MGDSPERLGGNSTPDTIVLLDSDRLLISGFGVGPDGGDGDDLGDELSGLLRLVGFLERLGGELVLDLTRDVVLLGDVLAIFREVISITMRNPEIGERERATHEVVPIGNRQSAASSTSKMDSDIFSGMTPALHTTYSLDTDLIRQT